MSFDALVLLGCRIGPGNRPSAAARRRAERAIMAWNAGAAPMIVVSGGRRWHGISEANALRQCLLEAGVPEGVIVTETRSLRTRQNARYSGDLLRSRGAVTVGVVSCDWHLPRALSAFRRLGFEATGLAAQSPPVPRWRRVLRLGRERLSALLDRASTWAPCNR